MRIERVEVVEDDIVDRRASLREKSIEVLFSASAVHVFRAVTHPPPNSPVLRLQIRCTVESRQPGNDIPDRDCTQKDSERPDARRSMDASGENLMNPKPR